MAGEGIFLKIEGIRGGSADHSGTFKIESFQWMSNGMRTPSGQRREDYMFTMNPDGEADRLLQHWFPLSLDSITHRRMDAEFWASPTSLQKVITLWRVGFHESQRAPIAYSFALSGIVQTALVNPFDKTVQPESAILFHEGRYAISRPDGK